MSKSKVTKLKKTTHQIKTKDAASDALGRIGELQRKIGELERQMNAAITKIQEAFNKEAAPLNAEIESLFDGLYIWAQENREELLKDGGKTASLPTGELKWRFPPPSVRLTGEATVIETFKRLGMTDLIRTKDEVNKEAILQDPERVKGVKGVSVIQKEFFAAVPNATELEKEQLVKSA